MKLIEIKKGEHYIIVDDSEMREGDCWYNKSTGLWFKVSQDNIRMYKQNSNMNRDGLNKITHSTQPLEGVQNILLSEIEEAIYGYSVEKMALKQYPITNVGISSTLTVDSKVMYREGYILGFKAHQELVKDKLFTIEDMKKAYYQGHKSGLGSDNSLTFEEFIKSLLPKTEWDIEIIDGKIKLI